jgi:TP901 family phage tail tape measure protein
MANTTTAQVVFKGNTADLQKKLKSAEKDMQSFKDMGEKAAKGLVSLGAGFLTVRAAVNGLKSAVDLIANFEKANSELASVLGTTLNGVKELSDAAQVLGRSTKFTAAEVTSLQTALARLGFSSGQIQDMEEPVLKFAAAVGTDLASAADFAGAALRSFGLQSKDTQELLDMMAASTTKSALDFSKLQTSISTVGPVAKAFGLSASETVAFLGSLANAGFDASTAATALRNILLNLADSNGNLAKGLGYTATTMPEIIAALRDLNARGVDLHETLGMTDKRSVAAFNAFLAGVDTLDALNNELQDVDGSLDQMYDTMTDNVTGSVNKLNSAWQGLVLQLSGSAGIIKNTIDLLTKFVEAANRAFFKQARVDAAADFFSKGLEEAMQNGGVEAAEAWYNSMMDTIDKKFRQSIDADPRKYRANMEGIQKAWAAFGAKYFVNGPEAPANLNAGGGSTSPTITPVDPGGSNKKAVKDLATAVAELRVEMAGAQAIAAAFGTELDGEDAMLRTMKSGIESLAKTYGIEEEAIKQLIEGYKNLKAERRESSIIAAPLERLTGPTATGHSMVGLMGFNSPELTSEQKQYYEFLQGMVDATEKANEAINEAIVDGISNSIQYLADALWGLEEFDGSRVFAALLTPLAEACVQMGELIMAQGLASKAFQESLSNPYAAIAAGAALIAVGALVKAGLNSAIKSVSGGGYSTSVASSAYTSNASNPSSFGREMEVKVTGTLTANGSQLVAVLNNEHNRNSYTT